MILLDMGKESEYLTVGKTPLERMHKLPAKLDSIRRSKERGSVVLEAARTCPTNMWDRESQFLKTCLNPWSGGLF